MKRNKSVAWFKFSIHYLVATEFLLDIICKNKNSHFYFGKPISDKLLNKMFESNDLELFYAVMFNFYHALELAYKGIARLHGGDNKKNHSLSFLFSEKIQKIHSISLSDKKLLSCYIVDIKNKLPEFHGWLVSNRLTIDKFYEFLKYPESIEDKYFPEFNFLGKGEETLPFYKELGKDIVKLRKFIVEHYYEVIKE